MACLCETCVHGDTEDTKEYFGNTRYFCYNQEHTGYHREAICSEYEEEHMKSFRVGDKVTIVDAQALFPRYKEGDTAVVTGVCHSGVDLEMYDGCPQYASFERVKLTPSCIVEDNTCSITGELTCCFECSNLEKCREEGNGVCDLDTCEKHEDYIEELTEELQIIPEEPCDTCDNKGLCIPEFKDACLSGAFDETDVCPMCTLEAKLADALETIDELKDELLADKELIIELQRQLLEKQQIWQ